MRTPLAIICAAALAPLAFADQQPPEAKPLFTVTLTGSADHAFSTGIDNGGDVAVTRAGVGLSVARQFNTTWRGSIYASTEASWYDFDNATGLIAGTGKPFSQLTETDVSPAVVYTLNDTWSFPVGLFFRVAGENDADVSDSFTWGGYAAARYQASKDFSVSFGLRANDRIEEDWAVLPALALDWQIDQQTKLEVQPAIGGIGFRLSSKRCDELSLFLDGVYQSREFRLANDAPLPEGVVRDRRFMLGGGLQWFPCEAATVTARAGVVAYQAYRIDDRNGVEQVDVETDPAPYIYLGFSMKF